MTREEIEYFRKIVKPFVARRLLAENYEGMGEADKADFERDFDAILDMAIKGLEIESCEDAISRNAVIDEIRSGQSYITKISPTGELEHLFDKENKALEEAVERVESLPKVKPVSVIATVKFNEDKLRELAKEQAQKLYDSILRCKDCKYFEYDSVVKIDGVPLIAAHEICTKWGDGCKTREDGFCYLAEKRDHDE